MSHSQKRSKSIHLHQLRKAFALKPLAVGVAGIMLTACGGSREQSNIYVSPEDCQ